MHNPKLHKKNRVQLLLKLFDHATKIALFARMCPHVVTAMILVTRGQYKNIF